MINKKKLSDSTYSFTSVIQTYTSSRNSCFADNESDFWSRMPLRLVHLLDLKSRLATMYKLSDLKKISSWLSGLRLYTISWLGSS